MKCNFTFGHLEHILDTIVAENYQVITLKEFFANEYNSAEKTIMIRVDVDLDCFRARRIAELLNDRQLRGTFFFRVHGRYNPLYFEIVNIIRSIVRSGHELGLHTELMDMQAICDCDPRELLRQDIALLEMFFETKIFGTASHGDLTGINNLDFWKTSQPADFGLLYEAYDPQLFDQCTYVSDSQYTSWKVYNAGKLVVGDARCACEHIKVGGPLVNLLIHPDTYYDRHFHERG